MQINADFAQRVLLHTAQMPWVDSPVPGVQRRMLDRLGDEVARATSVVRYAPNSQFTPHTHGGGEEFIVLDGVFQDEHGDFPTGSYIRNPPTSRHTPGSHTGCVIFVKLWQFDPADRTSLRLDMHQVARVPDLLRSGVTVAPLFQDAHETVQLEVWSPGAQIDMRYVGGAELLVIKGDVMSMGDTLSAQSWLRLPIGAHMSATAGPQGASVWLKTGHLRFIQAPLV
jgi:anti-sigma factor ChrR (cupin superfamily)